MQYVGIVVAFILLVLILMMFSKRMVIARFAVGEFVLTAEMTALIFFGGRYFISREENLSMKLQAQNIDGLLADVADFDDLDESDETALMEWQAEMESLLDEKSIVYLGVSLIEETTTGFKQIAWFGSEEAVYQGNQRQ